MRTPDHAEPLGWRRRGIEQLLAPGAACALLLICALPAAAAAQTLVGSVGIDPGAGTLVGSVCVDAPSVDGDLHFRLNSGLTVYGIDGGPPRIVSRELEPGGATAIYRVGIERTATGRAPCVEYGGRFPVYRDGDRAQRDGSEVIAFDGATVRARGASRWLPMPWDPERAVGDEAVTWDLRVNCPGCARVFMNGDGIAHGPEALFRAAEPREPFLLAGDLSADSIAGHLVVGGLGDPAEISELLSVLDRIDRFYSDLLDLPAPPPLQLAGFRTIDPRNDRRLWAFLARPALAFGDVDAGRLLENLRSDRIRTRNATWGLLAHEVAHRYFGWDLGQASPQRDLFGEPFAVLLELKAVREFLGEQAYADAVNTVRRQSSRVAHPAPLSLATADQFRFDDYRYGWAPTELLRVERSVGEKQMIQLMRSLLSLPSERRADANFAELVRVGESIGIPRTAW